MTTVKDLELAALTGGGLQVADYSTNTTTPARPDPLAQEQLTSEAVRKQQEAYKVKHANDTALTTAKNVAAAAFSSDANTAFSAARDLTATVVTQYNNITGQSTKFDPIMAKKDYPDLYNGLSDMDIDHVNAAGSLEQAFERKDLIKERNDAVETLQNAGWLGASTQFVAAAIDVDTLLPFIPKGALLSSTVAKGLAASGARGASAAGAVSAASALESAAFVNTVGAFTIDSYDPANLPASMLSSMAIGAGFGSIYGVAMRQKSLEVLGEFAQQTYNRKTGTPEIDPNASAGAAATRTKIELSPELPNLQSNTKSIYTRARNNYEAQYAKAVINGKLSGLGTGDSKLSTNAEKVQNFIDAKTPLRSLYTEVANMGDIGADLAYNLLSHPGGMIENNLNAGVYKEVYLQDISKPVIDYHSYVTRWLGKPDVTIKDKLQNSFVRQKDSEAFSRELRIELEHRWHKRANPNPNPIITEYADLVDGTSKRSRQILQGRAGETPVEGSDLLEDRSGYYPRAWQGAVVKRLGISKDQFNGALKTGYKNVFQDITRDERAIDAIVASITDRTFANADGVNTNVIGMLREDGSEFIEDSLRSNGIPENEIASIMGKLIGKTEERLKQNFLKDRIDLDMTTMIPGTPYMLLDMLEPDFYVTMQKHNRKVAGSAAMARKGIQKSDIPRLREAMKDEMSAAGYTNVNEIDETLDVMFSYFTGGAVGKGMSKRLLSVQRLTNMSLLTHLGISQAGELGNVIAAAGAENVWKLLPGEIKSVFTKEKTALAQELHDAFIYMHEPALHDPRLALDEAANNTYNMSEGEQHIHNAIAAGSKVASNLNFFNQTNLTLHSVALGSLNARMHKAAQNAINLVQDTFANEADALKASALDISEAAHLERWGINPDIQKIMYKYTKNNTMTPKPDGSIEMNFNKWDKADLEQYKMGMNIAASRMIQKNLPGEDPLLASNPMVKILFALRTFGLNSIQKQTLRQLRYGDVSAAQAFMWNTAIAGIAYGVSENVKGRGEDLTVDKWVRGAIGYAGTTGGLSQVYDPVASMVGLPSMSSYYNPDNASGIIPVPPAISTLNRMMHAPAAAVRAVTGNASVEDIDSMRSIANLYGMSMIFQKMQDNIREEKAAEKQAARAQPKAAKEPAAAEVDVQKLEDLL